MQQAKRQLIRALFYALLCYAGLLLFSVNYLTIAPGLDPSWGFAMNLFRHGPLKFGVDFVYTYGPLAYLEVPQQVGNNIADAAIGRTVIWCVLVYLVAAVWQSGRRAGAAIFVLGLIASNRLFYFYWDYLLVAIVLLLFMRLIDEPKSLESLLLLAAVIGLSCLVKLTAFMAVMLLLVVYTVSRLARFRESTIFEWALLALAFVSGPIAYFLYNPSLIGLLGYIRGGLQISSGYSAAMSSPPSKEAALRALLLCLALAASAAFLAARKLVTPAAAIMAIAMGWMALKHGYVRADPSHEAVFCCFIVLPFAFLLAQIRYTLWSAAICLMLAALVVGVALQGANQTWPVWSRFWWSPRANMTQAAALLNWDSTMNFLDVVSESAFRDSPIADYSVVLGRSRVLFFPWDLSYGAHQKFTTVPLFATQAYTSYTHYLDQEGASHILHASPPLDFVLFEWKSVDLRNPVADVPATWNTLFSNFAPVSLKADALLLKRRSRPILMTFNKTSKSNFIPQTWVSVPERSTPVGLSVLLQPTLAGAALQTLYQVAPVFLQLRTRSGVSFNFRVPPDVISSPFPISSLPVSAETLNALWDRNEVLDPISAIRLTGPGLEHFQCDGYQFYDVVGTEIHTQIRP